MSLLRMSHGYIHYDFIEVSESDNDVLLVFLHEALGSIPQWREFPNQLCESLNLNGLIYERQGHGQSSPFAQTRGASYLHDYAFDEMTQVIGALIPEKTKLILVGHSDGGTIALLFASRFTDKVKFCITLAAHVINETETILGIEPALKAFEAKKLEKLRTFHGDKTNDLFYAWADTWRSEAFKNWNILDELTSVSSPVLALQGDADQYGTERQLQLIERHINSPCKTKLLASCGHHPHYDQPNNVVSEIKKFIHGLNKF